MKKIIITEGQEEYTKLAELIHQGYLIHGTVKEFDSFDPSFIQGGCRGKEGYGFYFTDMPCKCQEYSNGIYKIIPKNEFNFVGLDTDITEGSPLYKSLFGDDEKLVKVYRLEDRLDYCFNSREYDYLTKELEKAKKEADGILKYDKDMFILAIRQDHVTNLGGLQFHVINPKYYLPKLVNGLIKLGYDGAYYDGVYTVWNFDKLNKLVKSINLRYGE